MEAYFEYFNYNLDILSRFKRWLEYTFNRYRIVSAKYRMSGALALQNTIPNDYPPDILEADNILAERLIDTYGTSILRLAYSYVHNMSDSEEILQDTLMKYIQTRPDITGGSQHEKAWLLRVTANIAKNRIDYNNVRMTDELDDNLIQEEKTDLAYVWEAVKDLPTQYREVIHMFYYEGYSTKEIAKILARKESSIRSDLHRGRNILKTVLKEAYDFE